MGVIDSSLKLLHGEKKITCTVAETTEWIYWLCWQIS